MLNSWIPSWVVWPVRSSKISQHFTHSPPTKLHFPRVKPHNGHHIRTAKEVPGAAAGWSAETSILAAKTNPTQGVPGYVCVCVCVWVGAYIYMHILYIYAYMMSMNKYNVCYVINCKYSGKAKNKPCTRHDQTWMGSLNHSGCFRSVSSSCKTVMAISSKTNTSMDLWWYQWEFQDPKMELLYHTRPYFVGIEICKYVAIDDYM